ncbi:XRE family transcriptional regulator [Marinifilum sp. JC120]|nr:XRE family transcriptional regulator [Marinifilum sp. JC120]
MALFESLFSGSVPTSIHLIWDLWKYKNKSTSCDEEISEINRCPEEVAVDTSKQTEAYAISRRVGKVVEMMNAGRHTRYTLAELAQVLGMERVGDLEKIISGENEPSFKFLKDFSCHFGVDFDWLASGQNTPFATTLIHFNFPGAYLEIIEEQQPEKIYFVMCQGDTPDAFIVLKNSRLNYSVCPTMWRISSRIDYGVEILLHDFYKMQQKMDAMGMFSKCYSVSLKRDVFHELHYGEIFPGRALEEACKSKWFEDFFDIYHKYPIADRYGEFYGAEFLLAQGIVRDHESKRLDQ